MQLSIHQIHIHNKVWTYNYYKRWTNEIWQLHTCVSNLGPLYYKNRENTNEV